MNFLRKVAIFVVFASAALNANAQPRIADERIVLSTEFGDLVLALYPDVAPAHVEHIKSLVRLGAYDTTQFARVVPGFVVQLSEVTNRVSRLSPRQQEAAEATVRAEFSDLKHRKGILSMARWDDDVDSATSSFSILLGDAPHLDNRYTIFGELESGGSTINRILEMPREGEIPIRPIMVRRAYVIDDAKKYYASHRLDPPELISAAVGASAGDAQPPGRPESAGIASNDIIDYVILLSGSIVVIGVAAYFLFERLSKAWLLSLLLVNVLISGFILFILLLPIGRDNPWLSALLFIGVFGLFRLMSSFENKRG